MRISLDREEIFRNYKILFWFGLCKYMYIFFRKDELKKVVLGERENLNLVIVIEKYRDRENCCFFFIVFLRCNY